NSISSQCELPMKSLTCMLVLLPFISLPVRAGARSGTQVNVTSPAAFSKFGSGFWSSGGAGVAGKGIATSPFVNPSAMNYLSLSYYLETTHRFQTTIFGDLDYDGQTIVPAYASVGFSSGTTCLAFGYANIYDEHYEASIPETTPDNPEGTGQTIG